MSDKPQPFRPMGNGLSYRVGDNASVTLWTGKDCDAVVECFNAGKKTTFRLSKNASMALLTLLYGHVYKGEILEKENFDAAMAEILIAS